MIKKHVYERPMISVLRVEGDYGLLAGSDKSMTTDGSKTTDGYEESNPDKIDAKKNGNLWGNELWDN